MKIHYIPTFYFVDDNDSSYPDEDKPLYEQVFNGCFDWHFFYKKFKC